MAREFTHFNATQPDWITVSNEGLKFDGPSGATGFQPWTNFKRWREHGRVLVLEQSLGRRFVILPIGELSDVERQPLRELLRSQLQN